MISLVTRKKSFDNFVGPTNTALNILALIPSFDIILIMRNWAAPAGRGIARNSETSC
jgi:hypothetical protein